MGYPTHKPYIGTCLSTARIIQLNLEQLLKIGQNLFGEFVRTNQTILLAAEKPDFDRAKSITSAIL